jgi:hypothetical protein
MSGAQTCRSRSLTDERPGILTRVDLDVAGLNDLIVSVEDWLVHDDSEMGSVSVGDTIRNHVGVWAREWVNATDGQAAVTWIGGKTSRITGRVERADGVSSGFDLVCGGARFWMFTGAYDPPSGYVPPVEIPPDGSWITVEGELYIRPWYKVMSERQMEVGSWWPASCAWLVLSLDEHDASRILHLRASGQSEGH